MSVLVKKPFLAGLLVSLLTVLWGSLGFAALHRYLPAALGWIFCLLSPFAFTAGLAQVRVRETSSLTASAQSCPTLSNPTDYSPPGPPVHGILQARILEGVAISSSRGSSRPRDQTHVSYVSYITVPPGKVFRVPLDNLRKTY